MDYHFAGGDGGGGVLLKGKVVRGSGVKMALEEARCRFEDCSVVHTWDPDASYRSV